jgi:O-methyltransferase
VRYSVDEVSADRLLGWAFAPDGDVSVRVVVAGKVVGEATTGGYRIDVALTLGVPDAARSGFEFQFAPEHFAHVGEPRADVVLVLIAGGDAVETEPVAVPVLAADPAVATATGPAPLPPGVVALLCRFRPATYDRPWDDELAERAVTDLRFLLHRGPRDVPALHRHLVLLGQLWLRAAFVERYFPRENAAADLGAKDRSAVQNSAVEVYAVAAHLATVAAHGVDGPLLEFGCFKGFSAAILSDACHQLGRTLHVFDSFAGLPPSTSEYYRAGEFAGSRAEVEANVGSYGRAAAVTYHEGFFADTVPTVSLPQVAQLWMDVDLESSARDAIAVLPRLDGRGAVFSHECPAEAFVGDRIVSERSPETVIPPILDAFADLGRPVAGRHVHGHTGAFWDAEAGVPVLPTSALLRLRDLALEL